MTNVGRWGFAAGVAAVILWGIARLSEVPYDAARGHDAELRLSWRIRSEPERACRRRTPEELARLPVHMREEEVCERRVAPYRLRVTLDGAVVEERLVTSAGARADRPLFVFARFPVRAGDHAVRVEFEREGVPPADTGAVAASAGDAPTHAAPRPAPPWLVLDTTLAFGAADALVVAYDDEARRLRVVAGH